MVPRVRPALISPFSGAFFPLCSHLWARPEWWPPWLHWPRDKCHPRLLAGGSYAGVGWVLGRVSIQGPSAAAGKVNRKGREDVLPVWLRAGPGASDRPETEDRALDISSSPDGRCSVLCRPHGTGRFLSPVTARACRAAPHGPPPPWGPDPTLALWLRPSLTALQPPWPPICRPEKSGSFPAPLLSFLWNVLRLSFNSSRLFVIPWVSAGKSPFLGGPPGLPVRKLFQTPLTLSLEPFSPRVSYLFICLLSVSSVRAGSLSTWSLLYPQGARAGPRSFSVIPAEGPMS